MLNRVFSALYRTRIKVMKGSTVIMNLSLLLTIVICLVSAGLALVAAAVALLLGYRFSIQKDAPEFEGDVKEIIEDAGENLQKVVRSITGKDKNDNSSDTPAL